MANNKNQVNRRDRGWAYNILLDSTDSYEILPAVSNQQHAIEQLIITANGTTTVSILQDLKALLGPFQLSATLTGGINIQPYQPLALNRGCALGVCQSLAVTTQILLLGDTVTIG